MSQPPHGGWNPGPPPPQPPWPPQQPPPGYPPAPMPGHPPPGRPSLDGPTLQIPNPHHRPGPPQQYPPQQQVGRQQQFAAPPPGASGPARRRRPGLKWVWVGVVVLVVGGGGFWLATALGVFGRVFDQQAMERDIPKLIGQYYPHKKDQIGKANCPANQPITTDHKFTCTIDMGKEGPKTVDIVVLKGTEYSVGLPR